MKFKSSYSFYVADESMFFLTFFIQYDKNKTKQKAVNLTVDHR